MGKRYYDNYDYEEAYKEQCKKLEEAEMERWMKEGWVNCLYRTSTYKSTNTESNTTLLESMVYPSFKFKADMPKTVFNPFSQYQFWKRGYMGYVWLE